jgi:hypothetical protein
VKTGRFLSLLKYQKVIHSGEGLKQGDGTKRKRGKIDRRVPGGR